MPLSLLLPLAIAAQGSTPRATGAPDEGALTVAAQPRVCLAVDSPEEPPQRERPRRGLRRFDGERGAPRELLARELEVDPPGADLRAEQERSSREVAALEALGWPRQDRACAATKSEAQGALACGKALRLRWYPALTTGEVALLDVEPESARRLVAVELATGRVRWDVREGPWPGPAAQLLLEETLVLRRSPTELRALDLRTGRQRWALSGFLESHAVDARALLVSGGARAELVDARTGERRWCLVRGQEQAQPAPAGSGFDFVGTHGDLVLVAASPWLLAVRAGAAEVRWRRREPSCERAWVREGAVLCAGEGGLSARSAESGELLWRASARRPRAVALEGGWLYAAWPTEEGEAAPLELRGIEVQTGRSWRRLGLRGPVAELLAEEGVLFAYSSAGRVEARAGSTGEALAFASLPVPTPEQSEWPRRALELEREGSWARLLVHPDAARPFELRFPWPVEAERARATASPR